jgi:hypothetical protein
MRILSGWKQIADHMQQGVRTVQRWELMFGLPVHRPKAGARGAVIAFAEELEGWGRTMPTRHDVITELRARIESLEAEVQYLKASSTYPPSPYIASTLQDRTSRTSTRVTHPRARQ